MARAEPALIEAEQAVSGVQAKDIRELQGYRNPSANIKLGLESCIALLKNVNKAPSW